eukprot:TRINITY_DN197296_c0_g5_i1.p1 TRINITY_DN197296_c0_g5~~TRINITY_DN197296_c0_g5_i1.p1  ORF type:complete len:1328 (+),score=417.53 TRINITY_DN197296_c0_g5_i1:106-3984(+)
MDGMAISEILTTSLFEIMKPVPNPSMTIEDLPEGKRIVAELHMDSPFDSTLHIEFIDSTVSSGTTSPVTIIPLASNEYTDVIDFLVPTEYDVQVIAACKNKISSTIIKDHLSVEAIPQLTLERYDSMGEVRVGIRSALIGAEIRCSTIGEATATSPLCMDSNGITLNRDGEVTISTRASFPGYVPQITSKSFIVQKASTPIHSTESTSTEGIFNIKIEAVGGQIIYCTDDEVSNPWDNVAGGNPMRIRWNKTGDTEPYFRCAAAENGKLYSEIAEITIDGMSCGDGIILDGVEECDDGNITEGDGCNAKCSVEDGFKCANVDPLAPSVCFSEACTDCGKYLTKVYDWSPCDTNCGEGQQTRKVECIEVSSMTSVDISLCSDVPQNSRVCSDYTCPLGYNWKIGEWGPCNSDCNGHQLRAVFCINSNHDIVSGNLCDAALMPIGLKSCGLYQDPIPCPGIYHLFEQERTCSKSCGGGTSSVSGVCVDSNLSPVDSSLCAPSDTNSEFLNIPCNTFPCELVYNQAEDYAICSTKELEETVHLVERETSTRELYKHSNECYGQTERNVYCADQTGVLKNNGECDKGITLGTSKSCKLSTTDGQCDDFCDNDHNCSDSGSCVNGKCECDMIYFGEYCQSSTICPTGILDSDGGCCDGILDTDGDCCSSKNLDSNGECCPSNQVVDSCGICGGDAVVVDVLGQCCSTLLDAGGICCESGEVDECGVCNGLGNSCGLVVPYLAIVEASMQSSNDSVVMNYYKTHITGLIGVTNAVFKMDLMNENRLSIDKMLFDLYFHDTTQRALALMDQQRAVIENAAYTIYDHSNGETADNDKVTSHMYFKGICGDGVCQVSEICDGTNSSSCCPSDCRVERKNCERGPKQTSMCGLDDGKGVCLSSGICECFAKKGYTGDYCDECAEGWFLSDNGKCIRLPLNSCFDGKLNGSEEGIDCGIICNKSCPTEAASGGGGFIVIAAAGVALIALLGIGLIMFKKKKNSPTKTKVNVLNIRPATSMGRPTTGFNKNRNMLTIDPESTEVSDGTLSGGTFSNDGNPNILPTAPISPAHEQLLAEPVASWARPASSLDPMAPVKLANQGPRRMLAPLKSAQISPALPTVASNPASSEAVSPTKTRRRRRKKVRKSQSPSSSLNRDLSASTFGSSEPPSPASSSMSNISAPPLSYPVATTPQAQLQQMQLQPLNLQLHQQVPVNAQPSFNQQQPAMVTPAVIARGISSNVVTSVPIGDINGNPSSSTSRKRVRRRKKVSTAMRIPSTRNIADDDNHIPIMPTNSHLPPMMDE